MSITLNLLEQRNLLPPIGQRPVLIRPGAEPSVDNQLSRSWRAREFQSALDGYIADYCEYQKRRPEKGLGNRTRIDASRPGGRLAALWKTLAFLRFRHG
jgi:hypothetical protein